MASITSVAKVSSILFCLTALAACGGGQTGGEVSDQPHIVEGPPHCTNLATRLKSVDVVGPLGFSGAQVLAFAEGMHTARVGWVAHPMVDVHIVSGPESGQSDVELEVRYTGGSVRHVDSTLKPGSTDGPPQECNDWLEVDVDVTLRTSGGSLGETWTTRLAGNLDGAAIDRSFTPDELDGSFYAEVLSPENGSLENFFLSAAIARDGALSGQVSSNLVIPVEGGITAAWVDYALWPAGTL
jgi:hypothetical protein